ncbi:monovalent cation/H+ antiporter complex subunit F [Nakamurella multipartita]|jgi:multicomponent Na+:H+ antiporter subunit F|uniref:Multiple resistance and pH regulation protein F n=1 Tax=Nakamurella multipartita (strain ATCC 700099 / DSM 44233 / CIP 104796 / JCM 9543 / NBRC 105858 / Y-104) TaxID=479431 RepID=C8XH07_NAKMY|nr:monovalent cation/H+ antiporter complex subunit F [Nakamurella multipartita]ACV80238.1 multiple resistance and pH regulation protein F [Nakamurella multipartita DSM 44233]
MTLIAMIAGTFFGIGALLAAIRLVKGPTQIDRAVALDVLLAILVGVIVLTAAVSDSSITLVIAVVVSLLGFLGSASLAKLMPRDRR